MRYTNVFNLPETIVNAIIADDYDYPKDKFRIPANMLISPLRQMLLRKRHDHEIIEDVSDNVWRLLGQAMHYIIDKNTGDNVIKDRLEVFINDYYVTGKPDYFDPNTGTLLDYKVTSAWTLVFNPEQGKKEWSEQINVYAWLLSKLGYEVNNAKIIAILRDWNAREQQKNLDYPINSIQTIEIPLWTEDEQEKFITDKLSEINTFSPYHDDGLPVCSPEDRWQEATTWAFYKKDGDEKAYRVMKTEESAINFEKDNPKLIKKVREGSDRRCLKYCSVAKFCSYYKSKYEGISKED